jgi:hypothetical protein
MKFDLFDDLKINNYIISFGFERYNLASCKLF